MVKTKQKKRELTAQQKTTLEALVKKSATKMRQDAWKLIEKFRKIAPDAYSRVTINLDVDVRDFSFSADTDQSRMERFKELITTDGEP